jgi:hypothetical protein
MKKDLMKNKAGTNADQEKPKAKPQCGTSMLKIIQERMDEDGVVQGMKSEGYVHWSMDKYLKEKDDRTLVVHGPERTRAAVDSIKKMEYLLLHKKWMKDLMNTDQSCMANGIIMRPNVVKAMIHTLRSFGTDLCPMNATGVPPDLKPIFQPEIFRIAQNGVWLSGGGSHGLTEIRLNFQGSFFVHGMKAEKIRGDTTKDKHAYIQAVHGKTLDTWCRKEGFVWCIQPGTMVVVPPEFFVLFTNPYKDDDAYTQENPDGQDVYGVRWLTIGSVVTAKESVKLVEARLKEMPELKGTTTEAVMKYVKDFADGV